MAKNRYVNTHFWNDSYIVELKPSDKLIFLYLLTNPLTNAAGIYEITMRQIAFDTGLNLSAVEKALNQFERDKKVVYLPSCSWVIIPNFLKNQKLNTNMQAGINNLIETFPADVKLLIEGWLGKALEGFESLSNALKYFNLNLNLNLNSNSNSVGATLSGEPEPSEIDSSEISFQEFYELFPRHEGKAAAEKAWQKIKPADKPTLIAALKKQIAARHINVDDKKFCPLPASWLNGERWTDDVTAKRAKGEDGPVVMCGCGAAFNLNFQGQECPRCQKKYFSQQFRRPA